MERSIEKELKIWKETPRRYRCWFDERKCAQGIKSLENYKKEWDDRYGCWASHPLHNWASHGSDAFRTLAAGLILITGSAKIDARTLDYREKKSSIFSWKINRILIKFQFATFCQSL